MVDLASPLSGAGFLASASGGAAGLDSGKGSWGRAVPTGPPHSACPPYEMIDLRKDPART